MRAGDYRLGLLQLNDRRPGMFTPETIALWERLAGYLAVALAKTRAEEARHASEEALRAANARLVAEDERKNEFLAMLSHELRNPLAPIRNSVYILERAAPGGEQATRAREVIERQAQHLTRLVDDLLDVTRIARGKVRLQRERVELGRVVQRHGRGHARGLPPERHRPRASRCQTSRSSSMAIPTRIAQMIGNLLQNAAKFTPPGRPRPHHVGSGK